MYSINDGIGYSGYVPVGIINTEIDVLDELLGKGAPGADDARLVVGHALGKVGGVLGLKGGSCSDAAKGVDAKVKDGGRVEVQVKLVVEAVAEQSKIIADAAREIAAALKENLNLTLTKLEVEIVELMTRDEFEEVCPPVKKEVIEE